MAKGQNIWFPRDLINSKAFAALKTATSHKVLAIFYTKRQFERTGRKGKEQWHIKNNCEIRFTYKEAERKYSISYGAFRNAIDELRDKGFIDIAESGAGLHKAANLYSINDRWKLYGTPEYEKPKPRPKGPVNRGFQRGNQYGRLCKKRKNSTVVAQHSSTVAG